MCLGGQESRAEKKKSRGEEEAGSSRWLWRKKECLKTSTPCSGRKLPGKVSVNFTFPRYHIILLNLSADSWV